MGLNLFSQYKGGCHCPFCSELKKSENGHGQKIGQNGHRKNGQKIGQNGQKIGQNGQKIGQNGHRIGHNVQTEKTDKKQDKTGIALATNKYLSYMLASYYI